jgi:hypothetical protein
MLKFMFEAFLNESNDINKTIQLILQRVHQFRNVLNICFSVMYATWLVLTLRKEQMESTRIICTSGREQLTTGGPQVWQFDVRFIILKSYMLCHARP